MIVDLHESRDFFALRVVPEAMPFCAILLVFLVLKILFLRPRLSAHVPVFILFFIRLKVLGIFFLFFIFIRVSISVVLVLTIVAFIQVVLNAMLLR